MAAVSVDKMFSALLAQQDTRDSAATTSLSSGMTLMQQKKYKEAIAAFKQATAFKPDLTDAYNFMASANLQLGNNKAAIEAYKTSLKVDDSQVEARVNLANIYIADKNFSAAEKELKSALRSDPAYTLAHYTLGQLYLQNDRTSEAASEFKAVLRLTPNDANGYYSLGLASSKQGDYASAVEQLTKASSLKRDFALAMFELGNAYIGLDQKDKAQEQLQALKNIPTSQAVTLSNELAAKLSQPKIFSYNDTGSNFFPIYGAGTPLFMLDMTYLNAPNASKDFTVQFQFDSKMDASSVMNIANWSIKKATSPSTGAYIPTQNDAVVAPLPKSVMYDPTTLQATLTFTISQNESGAGTIDPSHLIFKFNGKDINGKPMDPTADEYAGVVNEPF